jgi:hypothetical protein
MKIELLFSGGTPYDEKGVMDVQKCGQKIKIIRFSSRIVEILFLSR